MIKDGDQMLVFKVYGNTGQQGYDIYRGDSLIRVVDRALSSESEVTVIKEDSIYSFKTGKGKKSF